VKIHDSKFKSYTPKELERIMTEKLKDFSLADADQYSLCNTSSQNGSNQPMIKTRSQKIREFLLVNGLPEGCEDIKRNVLSLFQKKNEVCKQNERIMREAAA
jgi:hypothetical protein